ncbi:MAG: hypothetical protein AAFY72_16355 [Cyanobacteria bacterium J06649_4]
MPWTNFETRSSQRISPSEREIISSQGAGFMKVGWDAEEFLLSAGNVAILIAMGCLIVTVVSVMSRSKPKSQKKNKKAMKH